MGDPTQALNHYKEYSALKDSALNMQKLDKIETLMAEYDIEKKEESIAKLTQENEIKDLRNSQQVLTFAVVLALFVFICYDSWFLLKAANHQKRCSNRY